MFLISVDGVRVDLPAIDPRQVLSERLRLYKLKATITLEAQDFDKQAFASGTIYEVRACSRMTVTVTSTTAKVASSL